MAGKAESCRGCPNANICASSKPDEDISLIQEKLGSLKLILAVLSGKGGVGKSTISWNIASSIFALGFKTIILDLDLSGPSIPRLSQTEDAFILDSDRTFSPIVTKDGIGVVSLGHLEHPDDRAQMFSSNIKNYAIKKILKHCDFSGYDVLIVDTPPNITDEHLALANYMKPQYSVMVTTPQLLSLNDARRQIAFCKKTGIEILGVIENMKNFACPKCAHVNRVYPESEIEEFCKLQDLDFLGSIPLRAQIAKSSDEGEAFHDKVFDKISSIISAKLGTLADPTL